MVISDRSWQLNTKREKKRGRERERKEEDSTVHILPYCLAACKKKKAIERKLDS